jgi:hypothetical protein
MLFPVIKKKKKRFLTKKTFSMVKIRFTRKNKIFHDKKSQHYLSIYMTIGNRKDGHK